METGLLNFHDEENFASSLYDQGELSGMDGNSSLLDMMHSDFQCSSDYLNHSAAHWDSDQEQEHNGDIALLPIPPSECSSINNSKEDYQKIFFEWQEHLSYLQSLDPDDVDLRLDGQTVPEQLPDNIFEDSFESTTSHEIYKASSPDLFVPPQRSSTPTVPCSNSILSPNKSTSAIENTLNLSLSMSPLDVSVSGIDVSALGINVSALDIKSEPNTLDDNVDTLVSPDVIPCGMEASASVMISEPTSICGGEQKSLPHGAEDIVKILSVKIKTDQTDMNGAELASPHSTEKAVDMRLDTKAFQGKDTVQGVSTFNISIKTEAMNSFLPTISPLCNFDVDKVQHKLGEHHQITNKPVLSSRLLATAEVEKIQNLVLKSGKEDQKTDYLTAEQDCSLKNEVPHVPVLEAGNLESLLEQFEASVAPFPSCSQSMPASPAHFSFPSSPLSMPASPSCTAPSSCEISAKSKTSNQTATLGKLKKSVAGQPSPAKWTSLLKPNIMNSISPAEAVSRIKMIGKKKTISLVPAMPGRKDSKSGTRIEEAGAASSRNKLLKIVSKKSTGGKTVQLDHDYCTNDSHPSFYNADPLEYIPQNLVLRIKANQKRPNWDDEKCPRKDSGLESGDVSEDSEGTLIPSGASSGCETGSSSLSSVSCRLLKAKVPNPSGRNREQLMVSVLKKTKNETSKLSSILSSSSTPFVDVPEKVEIPADATALKSLIVAEDLKTVEQPKKRKLNLEEYRNRQRALQHEREQKVDSIALDSELIVKQETDDSNDKVLDPCITVVDVEPIPEENKEGNKEEEINSIEVIDVSVEQDCAKQPEERRRRRQYRIRHSSTSSSEGPHENVDRPISSEKKVRTKKSVWANSKSRSRSRLSSSSSSTSQSRSSSSSSSGSCSTSSSSSCSSRRSSRSRKGSYETRRRSRSRRRSWRGRSPNRSRESSKGCRSARSWRSRKPSNFRRKRSRSRNSSRRSLSNSSFSRSRSRSTSCSRRRRSVCRSRSRELRMRYRSKTSRSRSRSRSRDRSRLRTRSRSTSSHRGRRRSRCNFRSSDRKRDKSRDGRRHGRSYDGADKNLRRSRSPMWRRSGSVETFQGDKEHSRQVEERRVVYVGRIPQDVSKADLRARFEVFGPVVDISLHFREHADNYGFVTFAYKVDAYEAVERGNNDVSEPHFDLCFGGRRKFCKERYADLDGMACKGAAGGYSRLGGHPSEGSSFDQMLREAQAKLRERKKP